MKTEAVSTPNMRSDLPGKLKDQGYFRQNLKKNLIPHFPSK